MNNIIVFDEKISTYNFYSKVLRQFFDIHASGEGQAPVLDFCNTKYISPTAVPVLLCFGDYLKRYYEKIIKVVYNKGSELHNFFRASNFYQISNDLGIFEWEEDILSGVEYKELRDLHKISYTQIKYSDAEKIKDLEQKKNYIFDCLLDRSKVVYEMVLRDTNQLPENVIDSTLKAIAETETNAIMYSGSHSFTYVASNRYGTNISIADSGRGFETSFIKTNKPLKMLEKFQCKEGKFRNYLIIMSALNFSFEEHRIIKRENLWTLRTNVINNNGTFKIQYKNTQVIFSSNRCRVCRKNEGKEDISMCVQCLMDKYSMNTYSPIKIFSIAWQGVRVEITIDREG